MHLRLDGNNIQVLPYGFVNLGLKSLDLRRNTYLKLPPKSIADSGLTDILAFFQELRKGGVKVNRGKLMLVGHGRAGKSTLAKALIMKPAALRNLLQELKDKAGVVP